MDAAVRAASGGVALAVEVVPGARASRFPAGYNPWREAVEAKVRAPPERGAANAELVALVAAFFGVPEGAVAVARGLASRSKTVTVAGLDAERARERLRASQKA